MVLILLDTQFQYSLSSIPKSAIATMFLIFVKSQQLNARIYDTMEKALKEKSYQKEFIILKEKEKRW